VVRCHALGVALLALSACGQTPTWQPAHAPLVTRWAGDVSPTNAHPEYPRPQMRRAVWHNLNGLWEYALARRDSQPSSYAGWILVPYPIESALSGVADTVGPSRTLWYRRTFTVPESWHGQRVLLHFGAVDWEARVWVNGQEIGSHRGGYDPFTLDITAALRGGVGGQELLVAVWDPTDAGTQPRGKQVRAPRSIFYTSVTGIWQTVWIEPVPPSAIVEYVATPDVDGARLLVTVEAERAAPDDRIAAVLSMGATEVASALGDPGRPITLHVPSPRLWSPEDPFLYDLDLRLVRGDAVLDRVTGYAGLRKIAVGRDAHGVTRLLLNGRFAFQSGPLDQGYWPDGLYTAPTEDAMVSDLRTLKAMGFNMLRKHVKVEPETYYAWCDRLGLLVWQDMPSASIPLAGEDSDRATDPEAARQFETELLRMVHAHINHPSIVMWVPFNEGWGQFDTPRIAARVRAADPSRLVDAASGWYDRGVGDVVDIHTYPDPRPPHPERARAAVLGEYGGLGYNTPGHMWQESGWGYALFADREALTERFEDFFGVLRAAAAGSGLSAAVYTQTSDIETENNGLLTYDRAEAKIDLTAVALAQRGYAAPRPRPRVPIFVDRLAVALETARPGAEIRFTTDTGAAIERWGEYRYPITLDQTTTVRAQAFWREGAASRASTFRFVKVTPRPAATVSHAAPGVQVDVYQQDGSWRALPTFDALAPLRSGVVSRIDLAPAPRHDNIGLRFRGYVRVPRTGVYGFHLTSDDGSRLTVADTVVVDHDGVHGATEWTGWVALAAGLHPLELDFFQGRGDVALALAVEGPGLTRRPLPPGWLVH
jgi:hypothetical protein